MGFKKPYRSTPVVPNRVYAAKLKRKRMRESGGRLAMGLGVAASVFGAGMVLTNWATVSSALPSFAASASFQSIATGGDCPGLSVYDGDTIRCGSERVRIANIDAPELSGSPKCTSRRSGSAWCDFQLGIQSRDALREFLTTGEIQLKRRGEDRYGRTLARIVVNGQDAGDFLTNRGLARQWVD